jgi:hypothetical protein
VSVFAKLFGKIVSTTDPDEARAQQAYAEMREAMSRETPEQRQRFYLEVAALMGNESAAKRLAEMGPDPEKEKPN